MSEPSSPSSSSSSPWPPRMMSLPSRPLMSSWPALPQMTSSRVVPFSSSSAAVPVIVQSFLAPATLLRTPCAKAGPTMRPAVATETTMARSLMSPSLSLPERSARSMHDRRSIAACHAAQKDPSEQVPRPQGPGGKGPSTPCRRAPARAGALRTSAIQSESELQLAVGHGVAGVDYAGVGVLSTVHEVVAGDVVTRLQEIVSSLILPVVSAAGIAVPTNVTTASRARAAEIVVALAAVELVVLVIATDLVVVLLALHDVAAFVAGQERVVALAAADHVVALEAAGLVGPGPRADHGG